MTATLEINLPDSVKMSDFDLKMTLAAKLYEMGTLSGGQAAELAGVSKRTFIELLGKYDTSVFGYDADELEADLIRTSRDAVIARRKLAVDRLRGIASVPGKVPPTDDEWREQRTEYLLEKHK